MTNSTITPLLVLVLGAALAGCGRDAPTTPSPPPQPPGPPAGSQPAPQPRDAIQLAGTVSDAAWRPLAGARVEVIDGPQSGLFTTTNARGEFTLSGAFDSTTRVQATKDSHAGSTRLLPESCAPCNPHWWIHFQLDALASHPNLAGDYSVSFIADTGCATLPDDARTRSYRATVVQASNADVAGHNSRYDMTLTGSTFVDNRVTLGVAGDYLAAWAGDGHGSPSVIEEVTPNTYLTLDGVLTASISDASLISGSFHGTVERCELPARWASHYGCSSGSPSRYATCYSVNHQLTLRRR